MTSVESDCDVKLRSNCSKQKFSTIEKLLILIAIFGFLLCVTLLVCLGIMVINYKSCPKNSTEKLQKRDTTKFFDAVIPSVKIIPNNHSSQKTCHESCSLDTCKNEADFFLKNIDETADPCDDFYKFACGNFIKNSVIPDDENKIDMLSITQNQIIYELIDIMKEEVRPNELDAFKKMKIYYKNCMSLSHEEGVGILLETLNDVGGWPVLEGNDWQVDNYNWIDVVYKTKYHGYPVLFPVMIGIKIDSKNTTKNIITLLDAVTRIRQTFLVDGPNGRIMQAYYNYMIDIAVMLGANKETAAEELKLSLDFELDLYNIQSSSSETPKPLTISELSARYPSIPWLELINRVLETSGTKVDDQELVQPTDPGFLSRLERLISRTPERVLANFLMWQIVYDSVDYLPEAYLQRKLIFSRLLSGVTARQTRARSCAHDLLQAFPVGTSALYVRRSFERRDRDAVLELVDSVKRQFRDMLKEVDWMDGGTRKVALEKIDAMDVFVGYSDELLDDRKVSDYYRNLEIRRGSYLRSAFNVSLFFSSYYYGTLRKPVDKKDWTTRENAAVINAYYYVYTNTFEIPAGFLRGSFYNTKRPHYLNYGAIGSIIGHEITHGFDSDGRKSDKNGNEIDWWQPRTKQMYVQKAKCFIDQYNNFTVEEIGLKVNGERTQSENIADNGGLRAAYRAYVDWTKQHQPESCLPGLGYSGRQLFWISAASSWCSKQTPELLRESLSRDQHSPPEARVIVPLSNIAEFAEDFNCPLGSRMNPVHKCVVW